MKNIFKTLSVTTILLGSVHGLTLQDTVKETLSTNVQISSNNLNAKSKLYEIKAQEAGYYPTVDLNAYLEKSQTKSNSDTSGSDSWNKKDGHRTTLTAEQLLYDGSNTSAKIDEAKYDHISSNFDTIDKNEFIILDSVKAYMELLTQQSKQYVTNYSILAHEEALNIAYDQEDISGEILETKKTISYIELEKDINLAKQQSELEALSNFVNITSFKPLDELCIPKIDITLIPTTLEESIDYALENSNKYKKQQAIVNRQKSRLTQTESNYQPTVKLRLDGSYDDDLQLVEDGTQKEINGKIDLNWNLYRGGRDESLQEKEKITLLEQNKILEQIKRDIIKNTTNSYNNYLSSENRIKNLNKALKTSSEILDINRKQLEDGTKTFIDVLDAQNKIRNTQDNLIQQEMNHIENYYALLNEFSILTKAILKDFGNECTTINIPNLLKNNAKNETENLLSLEDDATSVDNAKIDNSTAPIPSVSNVKTDLVLTGGVIDALNFDNMKLNINNSKFGLKSNLRNQRFKAKLDNLAGNLLDIVEKDFDNIKEVQLLSYASSEYKSQKTLEAKARANMALTAKRLVLLESLITTKAADRGINLRMLGKKLVSKPMGASNYIFNEDGTENKEASRRIIIKIIQ